MIRNFKLPVALQRGTRFWLQVLCASLLVLNGVALIFRLVPPWGTRHQLTAQQQELRNGTLSSRARSIRLRTVAAKVQTGGRQAADFQNKYFLPRRQAYAAVVEELQRVAGVSGIHERDAVYSEEPIEGTADLSLMNSTANYEGTYENLLKFLQVIDQSPMLLMLDNLQASPQQKGGVISTSIRFQTIVRDDGTQKIGEQP